VKLALAIPTTASWAPGRKESLLALLTDLGFEGQDISLNGTSKAHVPLFGEIDLFIYDNRSLRHEWFEKIANWGLATGADFYCQIQDDIRTAPADLFWHALHAMLRVRTESFINLQAVHQATPALAAEGCCGCTTTEGSPGPSYVLRREFLESFMKWRKTSLKDGAVEKITEDTLMGVYCLASQQRIFMPVPTLTDHPQEVKSTFGNDKATRQRPLVRWDNWSDDVEKLKTPDYWKGDVRHLGRFYPMSIPELARRHVKGYTEADKRRDESDKGTFEMARLYHARRARQTRPPAYRVFVCSPHRGGFSHEYLRSMFAAKDQIEGVELVDEIALSDEVTLPYLESENLVVARSRMLRQARESDCTHVWFVDADCGAKPVVLFNMLRSGFEMVQATYPRRDGLGFSVRWLNETLEKGGLKPEDVHNNCVEIQATGFGCTVIARSCFDRMLDHYENEPDPPELSELARLNKLSRHEVIKSAYEMGRRAGHRIAVDDFPKWDPTRQPHRTTMLFQLIIDQDDIVDQNGKRTRYDLLAGEDMSFCKRWRAIGGKVMLYIGPGTPVTHIGEISLPRGDDEQRRLNLQLTGLDRQRMPEEDAPILGLEAPES
jgi:hypothetical protein